MVGALRWPTRPCMPTETGLPSVKARAGSWQVAQATDPSPERRGSKKSFSPNTTSAGLSVVGEINVLGQSRGKAGLIRRTGLG